MSIASKNQPSSSSLPTHRGRPLAALVLVLASWIGMRVVFPQDQAFAAFRAGRVSARGGVAGIPSAEAAVPTVTSLVSGFSSWPGDAPASPVARFAPIQRPNSSEPLAQPEARANAGPAGSKRSAGWFGFFLPAGLAVRHPPPIEGAWHSSVEIAETDPASPHEGPGGGPGGNAAPGFAGRVRREAASGHWSGDAWLLVRKGIGSLAAVGPGVPSYGADQSGAVLRYALSLHDPHRLAVYARVATALHDSNESELALGLQGRPFPNVPVLALGEVRMTRDGGAVFARPAAMAVTQLPPLRLPYGMLGDAYLQAGYVGGRDATAFVDGQVHVKKRIGKLGKGEWSLGAGGWGGAQTGASRLDLGPEATWHVPLNHHIAASVALDYRVKVAGNAQPGSGPALSIATGF